MFSSFEMFKNDRDPRLPLTSVDIPLSERLNIAAKRIQQHQMYLMFCVGMAIINAFLVIWMLINRDRYPDEGWFIFLEILVTVCITVEVSIRMMAARQNFWKSAMNWFDFIVMLMSITALFLYLLDPGRTAQIDDLFSLMVLSLRYCVVTFRVIALLRNAHSNVNRQKQTDDITFTPEEEYYP
eukprot:GILI01014719.1.p1 GENE.GILI01014719.1~~GILI01014719.1.p1  ORF type:complete len:183 (+),score=22.22 GILI01014719.1:96-644(+)